MKKRILLTIITAVLAAGSILAADAASNFMSERRAFREQIKNKIETPLDPDGLFSAVTFSDEQNRYNFEVKPEDAARIKQYLTKYLGCKDEKLLDRMVQEMDRGRYIIYKDQRGETTDLKAIFLAPKVEYWKYIADTNGIEKMFHVYNFSVGIFGKDPNRMPAIIQTEGTFFGITQAVNLPVFYIADENARTYSFHMPKQSEIIKAVQDMPPLRPGRVKPEEKFIDACRTHLYFQQKDSSGNFLVTDEDIMELYETTVTKMDEKCPVKETVGHWKIQEDYPYLLANYSLKTTVNVDALLPSSMRFMAGAVGNVIQIISDEVSVKYLPLSMKNFRDLTQKWTKAKSK